MDGTPDGRCGRLRHRSADATLGATVVLTGATAGIGRATALALAGRPDHLILHGVEPEQDVRNLLSTVRSAMRAGARLTYIHADYGALADVGRLALDIRGATDHVDILINNAGRPGPPNRTTTAEGNEITFQTNYLAPVGLTTRLLDLLGRSPNGRIVNVASSTHYSATLHLDDLAFARRRYSAAEAYAHSKLALVTYSCWLGAHRPSPSLDVVSMHPGVISTRLLHAMFGVRGDPPDDAARRVRYVASLHGDNGAYYDESRRVPPKHEATDATVQERLHAITTRLLDEQLPI
jgi:NAD(P)-dependent dehydrogenase (short-subunit alcohol dehydrogenase family)